MNIKERVQEIISDLNISQSMFEDTIGASRGVVSHLDTRISKNLLTKITAKYPQINVKWILTGNGEKYLTNSVPTERTTNTPYNSRTKELLAEVEKQRLIIARFQTQIDNANEQIRKCQEHINILLNAIAQDAN